MSEEERRLFVRVIGSFQKSMVREQSASTVIAFPYTQEQILSYRRECFIGKYTTHKIHMNLRPRP